MAIGDQNDMVARLKAVLPPRWFPDTTPVLDGVLSGLASAWTTLYGLLGFVRLQSRLATVSDAFLDLAATDYLGNSVARRLLEADEAFRARVEREILRGRGTRKAVVDVLTDLTGRSPAIFEFSRPADTGGWNLALGYSAGGGWGSLNLPFQALVTAYRAEGGALASLTGWGVGTGAWGVAANGGAIAYATVGMIAAPISDDDIRSAILSVLPVATIAWTRIED